MSTAAFIAARKAMLAVLLAAFEHMRDVVVNPANTTLNAAIANGDSALSALAASDTEVVLKLNAYHVVLSAAIAQTDALVASDPGNMTLKLAGSSIMANTEDIS